MSRVKQSLLPGYCVLMCTLAAVGLVAVPASYAEKAPPPPPCPFQGQGCNQCNLSIVGGTWTCPGTCNQSSPFGPNCSGCSACYVHQEVRGDPVTGVPTTYEVSCRCF